MFRYLFLCILFSPVLASFADDLDFLESQGVLIDQSLAGQLHCDTKSPCDCLKNEKPGTFFFLKTQSPLIVCYVDQQGHPQKKLAQVTQDRKIQIELGSNTLTFEDWKSKHPEVFGQAWEKILLSKAVDTVTATQGTIQKQLLHPSACELLETKTIQESDIQNFVSKNNVESCDQVAQKKGVHYGASIGAGSYGQIRIACLKTPKGEDCEWAEKKLPLGNSTLDQKRYRQFLQEVEALHTLGPPFTPEFFDAFLCLDGNVITGKVILKKMDGDLQSYLLNHQPTQEEIDEIFHLVDQFHQTNFVHQDLHSKNVLYKIGSDGKSHFYLVDFGLSHRYSGKNPKERSPRVQNFRLIAGGDRRQPEQKIEDLDCLIDDLYEQFGIEVTVESSGKTLRPSIKPEKVPRRLAIRSAMIEAMKNPENIEEDGNIILRFPERTLPMSLPIDKKLVADSTGPVLEGARKLKFHVNLSLQKGAEKEKGK